MLNSDYTFEKYSLALPYKEVDDTYTGVAANEARALRARSHMALVSQNAQNRNHVKARLPRPSTDICAHRRMKNA